MKDEKILWWGLALAWITIFLVGICEYSYMRDVLKKQDKAVMEKINKINKHENDFKYHRHYGIYGRIKR